MKPQANTQLSHASGLVLAQYERILHAQEDLSVTSIRIYLSDVLHFFTCYEQREAECTNDVQESLTFHPQAITTPTPTRIHE